MATPLPFPGLSALLGAYGFLRKSPPTYEETLDELPTITALIPALNEEQTITFALASLATQTVTPDRIVVVDDGSTDDTAKIVEEVADEVDVEVELLRHEEPMGKTVGVKEVARSVESEKLFVLDADTFLESDDYLERLLVPHAEPTVACSYGMVYPTETDSKWELYEGRIAERFPAAGATSSRVRTDIGEDIRSSSRSGVRGYLASRRPIIQFRNIQYHVEQQFFAAGFMRLFRSTLFPVGCGVLYDREKLVSVFDDYEESLGDNLTNSEDIFIGFAFCDRGWENARLDTAYMRSFVPGLWGTLKQNYRWGSGFLQSAYYFKGLSLRREKKKREKNRSVATDGGVEAAGKPVETARKPMGWGVLARLIDGIYPTTLLLFIVLWYFGILGGEIVAFLVLWEMLLYATIARAMSAPRLKFYRNLVPFIVIRFAMMPVLSYTYFRVAADIATGNRNWRK